MLLALSILLNQDMAELDPGLGHSPNDEENIGNNIKKAHRKDGRQDEHIKNCQSWRQLGLFDRKSHTHPEPRDSEQIHQHSHRVDAAQKRSSECAERRLDLVKEKGCGKSGAQGRKQEDEESYQRPT